MAGRWIRGLLHLMVGGACGALVGWLAFGFVSTILSSDGPARVAVTVLVLASVAVIGALLLAPPVRTAEVALARGLLKVDLPEPVDTTSLEARTRGLLWALVVIVLGTLSLGALLWAVPQGVVLVVAALAPGSRAGTLPFILLGAHQAVLVGLGVVCLVAGLALQPLLVVLLERLALRVLSPTPADRLAHAERERARLVRANDLARELHDSVGHALTAIGVQAEAGARVADDDPAFAREALGRIAETTRRAVAELDEVLGTLRRADAPGPDAAPAPGSASGIGPSRTTPSGAGPGAADPASGAVRGPSGDLGRVVDLLGDLGPDGTGAVVVDVDVALDPGPAATAYRIVQEGLTNARRHGDGATSGHVRVVDGRIEILLVNGLPADRETDRGPDPAADHGADRRRGGRGLVGMRERLAGCGGSLDVGPADTGSDPVWRLEAHLPARTGEAA
ncbi:histidine kinase [Georgenia sp. Z1491]|uniref:sensor histidine kinase n=1 Tax=Georgenia sp. Z1491 TaxID=3416707 RepID=UPI003CECB429